MLHGTAPDGSGACSNSNARLEKLKKVSFNMEICGSRFKNVERTLTFL